MNDSRRIIFGFSFFLIIFISGRIIAVSADGEESDIVATKEEYPSLLKIIYGIFGKKFPQSSWELIQGALQKILIKLYPTNLESNSDKNNNEEEDKGDKVKEAATRSLKVNKETIEESAKVAGDIVGEVVHKTAEKVKVTKQTSQHDEV